MIFAAVLKWLNPFICQMLHSCHTGYDHNTGTKNLNTTGQESQVLHLTIHLAHFDSASVENQIKVNEELSV
jgi:hypothetical protein